MTYPHHQIINSFLSAFATLDASAHTSLQTPNCIHLFAPTSLSPPAPKDNATFAAHITTLRTLMSGFPVEATEVFSEPHSRNITIWATSETQFREEAKDDGIPEEEWRYKGEYIFILRLDEKMERIERIVEFLDSKKTEELRALMARAKGNVERRSA